MAGAVAAGVSAGVLVEALSPQAARRAREKAPQMRGSFVFMVLEAWFAKVQNQSRGGKRGCKMPDAICGFG